MFYGKHTDFKISRVWNDFLYPTFQFVRSFVLFPFSFFTTLTGLSARRGTEREVYRLIFDRRKCASSFVIIIKINRGEKSRESIRKIDLNFNLLGKLFRRERDGIRIVAEIIVTFRASCNEPKYIHSIIFPVTFSQIQERCTLHPSLVKNRFEKSKLLA